ncbi:hypothetical protein FB567DRAFT_520138 [Paraphoma chrysanthemicola]|uniref:JmjC domain-containing protein n=1 Tax=Paraphoma chrysanthemicola TaxID=798071 RepID=A0A8K0RAQ8_9PLEO|nr:hypothetical protein FB567DRAFT_520138 [Paraphoma chrysanthemicola]
MVLEMCPMLKDPDYYRKPMHKLGELQEPFPRALIELQKCSSPKAAAFQELMRNCLVKHRDNNTGPECDRFEQDYNTPEATKPVIPIIEAPANPILLQPSVLKQMIRDMIEDGQWFKFDIASPRVEFGANDRWNIVRDLIETLDSMEHQGVGRTAQLYFRYFDQLATPTHEARNDSSRIDRPPRVFDITSKFHLSVMPSGAFLPLEWADMTRTVEIHVLSGVRVYFVWPPTAHNMKKLEEYFEDGGRFYTNDQIELFEELEGGNTIVQLPGQIVRFPPYCLTVVFTTKTSAAVHFCYRRIEDIGLRLRHVHYLFGQTALMSGNNAVRRDQRLRSELEQLAADMEYLLDCDNHLSRSQNHKRVILSFAKEFAKTSSTFYNYFERWFGARYSAHIKDRDSKLWDEIFARYKLEYCGTCKMIFADLRCEHLRVK